MYLIFSALLLLILSSPLKVFSSQNFESQNLENIDNSGCIKNYMVKAMPVAHSLTAEEIKRLESYTDTPAEGMKLLGEKGDTYAAIAEKVMRPDSSFPYSLYRKFIRNHWLNTVGEKALNEKFILVAKQHFKQYVEMVKTGSLPDSDQILNSYLNAVRLNNLPDITVFDAAWAASDNSKLVSWEKLNNLPKERIVRPAKACYNIDNEEANSVIAADFSLLNELETKLIYPLSNPTINNPIVSFFQILIPRTRKNQ